jgi:uncharacterized cupredoxin-like copper-binding protein
MAVSWLVRIIGVTAIGFGIIIGSAASTRTLAKDVPTDVAVMLGAEGVTPSRTALVAGQPYRFVVTNTDKATHSFFLESADASNTPLTMENKQAAADGIAAGQTTSFEWTFRDPGDYQMADDRAAKSEPGLVSQFVVVPADTPTLTVQLGDFSVTPGKTELQAGKPYLFEVTNTGAATHEFVVEPASAVDEPLAKVANGAKMEAEAEDIAPGQTQVMLWTFANPGDYQMACHVPGHFEAGMKAMFKVVP